MQEPLEVHIRGMVRSGEVVPEPTSFPGQITLQVPVSIAEDQRYKIGAWISRTGHESSSQALMEALQHSFSA